MHIVIDGYNLICRSRHLSAYHPSDLQGGRDALVDMLAAYKRVKPYKITVVFDSSETIPVLPGRDRCKGITLRFSRGSETADDVIKRMASRERQRLLVVSSDNDIVGHAQAKGAATIDTQAFEERIQVAVYSDGTETASSHGSGDRRTSTKKKGPSRRLPKKKRRMSRKLDKF